MVAEGGGWLRILDDNVLPFDRVVINRIATTQEHPDDIVLDLGGADTGRSQLTGHGAFTGIYGATSKPGINLHVAFSRAGDALTAVAAGKGLGGIVVTGGDGAVISADLTQPFAQIKVAAAIRGLDVRYGDYRAPAAGARSRRSTAAPGSVDVTKFGLGAPGGGKLSLDAHLDINKLALDAGLGLTAFHTESYLPRALRPLGGGRLDGKIEAHAELGKKSARLKKIDLRLARAGGPGLPREVRVRGAAELGADQVKTDGLTVSVAGADATAKGSINLDRQLVDLALGVVAFDLGRLCGELGLPPLGKDARVDLHADGSFDDPHATGEATVHGLAAGKRTVRELDARFGLEHGLARLERLSGPAFGGELEAHGSLRLWEKRASKPLRSPVVDLEARRARHRSGVAGPRGGRGRPGNRLRRRARAARRGHGARGDPGGHSAHGARREVLRRPSEIGARRQDAGRRNAADRPSPGWGGRRARQRRARAPGPRPRRRRSPSFPWRRSPASPTPTCR